MSKEPVGSVGEEAAKLFAALQQAAGDARAGYPPADPDESLDRDEPLGPDEPFDSDDALDAEGPAEGPLDPEVPLDAHAPIDAHAPVDGGVPGAAGVPGGDRGDEEWARGRADHAHGTAGGGGPECQWCPVCQLIAKVRNTSPETVEQLATVAAGVLGSVRSLVEAAAESARQARADAEARAARTDATTGADRTGADGTGAGWTDVGGSGAGGAPRTAPDEDGPAGWHEGAGPARPEDDGRPTRAGADRIDVSEDPEPWD